MSSTDCSCSICCDEIEFTPKGRMIASTLSCDHSFHTRCITSWFATQEKGTCPLCRNEVSELEDLAPISEDEEEEMDEEDEEEEEDEDDAMDEGATMFFLRGELDELLRSLGGVGVTPTMGFFQSFPDDEGLQPVATLTRTDIDFLCAGNGASMMSDEEWERRYLAQRQRLGEDDMQEEDENLPLSITWLLMDDGSWVRQVINPEQDTGVSATASELHGSTTAAFAQEKAQAAALGLQKVWRGFATRKAVVVEQAALALVEMLSS